MYHMQQLLRLYMNYDTTIPLPQEYNQGLIRLNLFEPPPPLNVCIRDDMKSITLRYEYESLPIYFCKTLWGAYTCVSIVTINP
jgi:hypothetical protein